LARLPFSALPTSEGKHLIDEWTISYLSTASDLLRWKIPSSAPLARAVVLADPDLDFESGDGRQPPGGDQENLNAASNSERCAADSVRVRHSSVGTFKQLPSARLEGKSIAQLLNVEPLIGAEATSMRILALRSPVILHLATHGFFLPPPSDNMQGDPSLRAVSDQVTAMSRSGIILAGFNTWARGETCSAEVGTGALTAAEIAELNLSDTQMVVLSACETGLGDVRSGEGVLGLRRAFALAGARSVVMSLWRIPDAATRELMEDFYRRLRSGESRAQALRFAQLAARDRWPRVRSWGAFLVAGEIGPITESLDRGVAPSAAMR
jgi:CHAT domain-containing protein